MTTKIPASVSDVLFHEKNSDRTERVIMPITRYKNVLNSPTVVKTGNQVKGSPFALLAVETEKLNTQDIRRLSSEIL